MNNPQQHQNLIIQAIDLILMNDFDDEFLADAIQSQAHLLSGHDSELIDSNYDIH